MKKQILRLSLIILILTAGITGCKNEPSKTDESPANAKKEQYQCPMKCTEEIFDKPGNCPVCGMDLEKISEG